jgi:hypothetical protein
MYIEKTHWVKNTDVINKERHPWVMHITLVATEEDREYCKEEGLIESLVDSLIGSMG